MNRNSFSVSKSRWKKQVEKVILRVDDIASIFATGERIGMGALYGTAHKLAHVGERGIELRRRLEATPKISRIDNIHESIASACKLVEIASKTLEYIADKQNTPLIDFPVFVSNLHVTSKVDTGRLEAFEKLRKEMGDEQ